MKAPLVSLPALLMSMVANAQSVDEMIAMRSLISHVMQVHADTLGSAVALSEHLGVTNCHVLGTARSVRVMRGGLSSTAKLTATETGYDLCLLEVEDSPSFPVKVGSAASWPSAIRSTRWDSVRDGQVSAQIEALYPYDGGLIVRSDAPFAAGASGGGLFDTNHNLVGVLTFLIVHKSGSTPEARRTRSHTPRKDQGSAISRSAARGNVSPAQARAQRGGDGFHHWPQSLQMLKRYTLVKAADSARRGDRPLVCVVPSAGVAWRHRRREADVWVDEEKSGPEDEQSGPNRTSDNRNVVDAALPSK
jgi:hypothetical protein